MKDGHVFHRHWMDAVISQLYVHLKVMSHNSYHIMELVLCSIHYEHECEICFQYLLCLWFLLSEQILVQTCYTIVQ